MNVRNQNKTFITRPLRSAVSCRPATHLAFRNDCAPILNDFTVDEDPSTCRLQRNCTSQTRAHNTKLSDSTAVLSTKCAPSHVRLENNNPRKGRQRTNSRRNNLPAYSCSDGLISNDRQSYSSIINHTMSLAKALKAADLNHLAVDVETVAKRLVFGRKKRPDITASDLPNSAVEHSKILTPSTETSPVNCLEIGEEPVCSCKHAFLATVNQSNMCDSCLQCVSSQLIHRGVQTGEASLKPSLTSSVDVAIQHTSPGISSQCSGNANCELRCVTPDFSEQGSEPAKQADPATSESPQKGDSFSGAGARVVDKKSVCRKSCYLPHASTNSNALVEENLERVETSQSKLFPQSSTSPNSKSPDLVVEIEAKERLPERHDAKSGNFEMACRTCRFQLRTISLQLCRRQVEFEVRRTEWDKRERILQEEISQLRSQAEQLARENAEVKRRLVDREAEINQIAQALHLLLEKLSLQQPFGAPAHPNQDQSLAAEEFLGLLRSLATKHLLRPFTAVAPDTQQTDLPSQNAAAMSASSSIVSDVSMSIEGSKPASTNSATPVIALDSSEPRCGGMRADNGLSFVKANSTSSRNEDDLETDGELDKDSLSDICIAARGSRRAPTATLARVETPVGSLYSSVSSLRTVDEVQFRTGLSSLDAQIAKLRLSLVSQ